MEEGNMSRDKGFDLPPKFKPEFSDLEPGRAFFVIQLPDQSPGTIVFEDMQLGKTRKGGQRSEAVIRWQGAQRSFAVSLTGFINGKAGSNLRIIGAEPLEDFVSLDSQTGVDLGPRNAFIIPKNDPEHPAVPVVIPNRVVDGEVVLGLYSDPAKPMFRINVADLKKGGNEVVEIIPVEDKFNQILDDQIFFDDNYDIVPTLQNGGFDLDAVRARFMVQRQEYLLSEGEGIADISLPDRDGNPVGVRKRVALIVRDPRGGFVARFIAFYEGVTELTGDALFSRAPAEEEEVMYADGEMESVPKFGEEMLKIPVTWFGKPRYAVMAPIV